MSNLHFVSLIFPQPPLPRNHVARAGYLTYLEPMQETKIHWVFVLLCRLYCRLVF